jgi:hypothetical protein
MIITSQPEAKKALAALPPAVLPPRAKSVSLFPELRNIVALTRGAASQFSCTHNWAAISIRDEGTDRPDIKTSVCLYLAFPAVPTLVLPRIADQIREFVDEDIPRSTETLMVHCEFGVSRGPAVAVALGRIYGLQYVVDRYAQLPYSPNMPLHDAIIHAYVNTH